MPTIVLENGIIWDDTILIKDGIILDFGREVKVHDGAEIIDAKGAYVGPGFVDIHCHGANTKTTCFDAAEVADFFLKHGTTTLLATPSYEKLLDKFLLAIRTAKEAAYYHKKKMDIQLGYGLYVRERRKL